MTTLVCWCGVDSRGPSSLYIASDSRFTWGTHKVKWDRGRKIAVRAEAAEILAFAGDVTLSQNLLLGLSQDPITDDGLHRALSQLTIGYGLGNLDGTAIVFARRIGSGMAARFLVTTHEYGSGHWQLEAQSIPTEESAILCAYGSGQRFALSEVRQWKAGIGGPTSRSVFSGFCDSLRNGKDSRSGPPPQLAGMYREFPAKEFGIVWDGKLVLAGLEPQADVELSSIEWRNDVFERCDPQTMKLTLGAQPHARKPSVARVTSRSMP